MKRYLTILLLTFTFLFAQKSLAGVSVGYETLTVLPNTFVLYLNDPANGWGIKTSADFGTSFISGFSNVFAKAFTAGLVNPKFSFVTLSITKDIHRSGTIRDFIRLGAFFITAQSGSSSITSTLPTIGIGRDISNFLNDHLIGNVELSYPEVLTFNLRYSF